METNEIKRDELAVAREIRRKAAEQARERALLLCTQGNDLAADHCEMAASIAENDAELLSRILALRNFDAQFVRTFYVNGQTIVAFGLDAAPVPARSIALLS